MRKKEKKRDIIDSESLHLALEEALDCVRHISLSADEDANMLGGVYETIRELKERLNGSVSLIIEGDVVTLTNLQATQLLRGMLYVGSDRTLADRIAWKGPHEGWRRLEESLWKALGQPDVNLFDQGREDQ